MPKLDPKQIQTELERGQFRTFYYLYGVEAMKVRELTKRIVRAYLGQDEDGANADSSTQQEASSGLFSEQFGEMHFDASQTNAPAILDELNALTLGVKEKVILLKNAHQLKDLEMLANEAPSGTFTSENKESSILICWAKDLDQRKKSAKALVERVAVVACEAIAEKDRAAWIRYLMKRRPGLEDADWLVEELQTLEPWTLDIVDQALAQFELTPSELREETFRREISGGSTEAFIESLLRKDLPGALSQVSSFAESPEESLPLVGLIAWNFRMLTSVKLGTHAAKSLMGVARDRMRDANGRWSLEQVVDFQSRLTNFDASLKGSGEDPRAAWANFVRGAIRTA